MNRLHALTFTLLSCLALPQVAFSAAANPRIVVVGAGDCRDPELALAVRSLAGPLSKQRSLQLLGEDAALSRLGRAPARSVEEIQRQIDGAQQQFYQAQYHKALTQIEAAEVEIGRLPPGQTRWSMWAGARVIEGLIRTRLKGAGGAEESFRRVLRLDPSYQLDRDYYGPSTLALFEQVRQALQKTKRARLMVKSGPSGADVYLDGKRVGATPYAGDHIPGRYQLVVGKSGTLSIPREVEVGPADLHVDLRFEGVIDTTRVPCITQAADEKTRLGNAVKLGALLGVDQIVVLRFERAKLGASWLAATLVGVDGGEKIREGGLQVGASGLPEKGMVEMARFVATGQSTDLVVAPPAPKPEEPPKPQPTQPTPPQPPVVTAPDEPEAPPDEFNPNPFPQPADEQKTARAGSWRRPVGQGLLGVGGVSLIAGAVMTGLGVSAENEYRRLTRGGLRPEDAEDAREARDRADLFIPVGFGGLGFGAAAAAAGALLWLTAPDEPPASSSPGTSSAASVLRPVFCLVPVGRDGAALSLSARF